MPLGSSSDAPVTSPGSSTSITERSLPTRPVVTGVSPDSPWPTLGIMLSVLLRLSGGAAIFGAAQPQTTNTVDACSRSLNAPALRLNVGARIRDRPCHGALQRRGMISRLSRDGRRPCCVGLLALSFSL